PYQLGLDVNRPPATHQASTPPPAAQQPKAESDGIARPGTEAQRQTMYRRVQNLERLLRSQIIGQEEAIASLVRAVKKTAVGLKRPNSPIGTFLLVGRTGTGKTELAKAVARNLFEDPAATIRIDCSEDALPHGDAQ